MSTVSAIHVQGLHKTFVRGFFRRKTVAVRGIDFAVEPGEIFGFLGPNGAGKTTTIKVLMGLILPSAGRATVLGHPAGTLAAKSRVGYLPERPYFYEYLSARELLDLVGRLHGQPSAERRRRAHDLIDRVGLAHAADRPLRSYSKGMVQRAGLAQALMGDAELIVLDEPMSGLDPIGRKDVRELVLEQRRMGKTVFFSTHILSDASMMCDRVAIVVRGELRGVGPLGELLRPEIMTLDVVWSAPAHARAELVSAGQHSATSEGEVTRFDDEAQANAFMARVLAAGGTVHQVTPHRQTLEDLFVRAAEGEGGHP